MDEGRHPPNNGHQVTAFAGDIKVRRFKAGVPQGPALPLGDVVGGPAPWLKVSGNRSAEDLAITPIDNQYDYELKVDGLVIAGTQDVEVQAMHRAWTSHKDLSAGNAAFDALRASIASTPNSEKPLHQLELARRDLEWELFGNSKQLGGVIPERVSETAYRDAIDQLIAAYGANSPLSAPGRRRVTSEFRGDWLTLVRGKVLPDDAKQSLASAMAGINTGITFPADVQDMDAQSLLAAASAVAKRDDQGLGTGPIAMAFVTARTIGGQSFMQALRLASFARFNTLDISSGDIENEILAHLRCLSALRGGLLSDIETADLAMLGPMRSLATSLKQYPSSRPGVPRKVKVTADDLMVCFQWFRPDGILQTLPIPRSKLTEKDLAQFKDAVLIADKPEDDLNRLLASLGANKTTSMNTVRREAAAKSVRLPPTTTAPRSEYVISQPSRGTEPMTAPGFEVAILDLDTRGDAGVVALPDGSLMLIDTGLSADFVKKLDSYFRGRQRQAPLSIRLVITHTDQDHIGGLAALLADGKITIDEMIVGRAAQESASAREILSTIEARGYSRTDGRGVTHFVRQGGKPPLVDVSQPAFRNGAVESFVIYPANDTVITMHHALDARTTNDAGFVVKVVNRGLSWLLTDDMTPRTMTRLLRSLPAEQLQAGYLRWPHHLWFPADGDTNSLSVLQSFVRTVNAHTYLFSNTGHHSHTESRFNDIKLFIKDVLRSDMNALWTDKEKAHLVYR